MKKKPKPQTRPGSNKRTWQLQAAKARFSELFRRARAEGPQWVTKQGKDAVVILAAEEFQRLTARSKQPDSLVEFFAKSPLAGANLDLERSPDYGREIDL
jgi:prevent-host-death family protein